MHGESVGSARKSITEEYSHQERRTLHQHPATGRLRPPLCKKPQRFASRECTGALQSRKALGSAPGRSARYCPKPLHWPYFRRIAPNLGNSRIPSLNRPFEGPHVGTSLARSTVGIYANWDCERNGETVARMRHRCDFQPRRNLSRIAHELSGTAWH